MYNSGIYYKMENEMSDLKRDKFVRLAEKRTNAVIRKIQILSNCANPHAYEYSEEDVRKIFAAIEDELKVARSRFVTNRRNSEFKLE